MGYQNIPSTVGNHALLSDIEALPLSKFGVTYSGVETQKVQDAIDFLASNKGGTLLVEGTVMVTQLKMRRNVTLRGSGFKERAVIKGSGVVIQPRDYTKRDYNYNFENLTIESDGSIGSICVDFSNITNSRLQNVILKNADLGVNLTGKFENGTSGGAYYNIFDNVSMYTVKKGYNHEENSNSNRIIHGVVQSSETGMTVAKTTDLVITHWECTAPTGIELDNAISTKIAFNRFENPTGVAAVKLINNASRTIILGNYYSGFSGKEIVNTNTSKDLGNIILDGFLASLERQYKDGGTVNDLVFSGFELSKQGATTTVNHDVNTGNATVYNFKENGALQLQLVYQNGEIQIKDSNFKKLFGVKVGQTEFYNDSGISKLVVRSKDNAALTQYHANNVPVAEIGVNTSGVIELTQIKGGSWNRLASGTNDSKPILNVSNGLNLPSVTTANRPTQINGVALGNYVSHRGLTVYDETVGKIIVWNGSAWKDMTGATV